MTQKSVKSLNPRLSVGQVCKSVVQTSYDIVKAHGESLEVESIEGKGSTFTTKLPLT